LGTTSALYASSNISINNWYHVVGTFNVSTNTGSLYINGSQVATASNFVGNLSMTTGAVLTSLQIGSGSTGISRADYEGILLKIFKKASNICFSKTGKFFN
jgi:hypothetical protein